MSARGKVLIISAVFMFLGWVEIAAITNFAHTITHDPPLRFWLGMAVAVAITMAFPLWRLSQRYKGLWQEIALGFFGFWLLGMVTSLIIQGTEGLGLLFWAAPVSLLAMFWVAQEADKQKAKQIAEK